MIYKLSPNEAERVIKEEQARKRVLRIRTVREQSKKNSENVLKSVIKEKERLFEDLVGSSKKKWYRENESLILETEKIISDKLKEVGQSHLNAFNSDYAGELESRLIDFKANQVIANERFKTAIAEQRKLADDKVYAENKHIIDRLIALEVEKQRTEFIASLPKPPQDPIDSLNLKLIAKKADHYVTKIIDTKVERNFNGDNAIDKAAETEMDAETRFEQKQSEILEWRQKAIERHNNALYKQLKHRKYEKALNDVRDLQKADINSRRLIPNKFMSVENDKIRQEKDFENNGDESKSFLQHPITVIESDSSEIFVANPVSSFIAEDSSINTIKHEQNLYNNPQHTNTGTINNVVLPDNVAKSNSYKSEKDMPYKATNIYTSVNKMASPSKTMANSKTSNLKKELASKPKNMNTFVNNTVSTGNINSKSKYLKSKNTVSVDNVCASFTNAEIDINSRVSPFEKNIKAINSSNSSSNGRTDMFRKDVLDVTPVDTENVGNFPSDHEEFNSINNSFKDVAEEEITNELSMSDKRSNLETEARIFEVDSGNFGEGIKVVIGCKETDHELVEPRQQNLKIPATIHSDVSILDSNNLPNLNKTSILSEGEISKTITLSTGELSDNEKETFNTEPDSNASPKIAPQNHFTVNEKFRAFFNKFKHELSINQGHNSNTVSTKNIEKLSPMQGNSLSSISPLPSDFISGEYNNFGKIQIGSVSKNDSTWQSLPEISQSVTRSLPSEGTLTVPSEQINLLGNHLDENFKNLNDNNLFLNGYQKNLHGKEPNIRGNILYLQSSQVSNDSTDTASTIYLDLPHANDNIDEFVKLFISEDKKADSKENPEVSMRIKIMGKDTDTNNLQNGIPFNVDNLNCNVNRNINQNKLDILTNTKYKFLNDDILTEDYKTKLKDFLNENVSTDSSLSFNQLSMTNLNHLFNSTSTTSTPLVLDISSFVSTEDEANRYGSHDNFHPYIGKNLLYKNANIDPNYIENFGINHFSKSPVEVLAHFNDQNVDLNHQNNNNFSKIENNLNNNNINLYNNPSNLSSGTLTDDTSRLITMPVFAGSVSDDSQIECAFNKKKKSLDDKSIILHPPYIERCFNEASSNIYNSKINSQNLAELYRIYFDVGSVETSETSSYLELPGGYNIQFSNLTDKQLLNLENCGKLVNQKLESKKLKNCDEADNYLINGDNNKKHFDNLTDVNINKERNKNVPVEVTSKDENLRRIITSNLKDGGGIGIKNWAEILKPFQKKIELSEEKGIMDESMISLVSANLSLTDQDTNINSSNMNDVHQNMYHKNKELLYKDLNFIMQPIQCTVNAKIADKDVQKEIVNKVNNRIDINVDNEICCGIANNEKYITSSFHSYPIRIDSANHTKGSNNQKSKPTKSIKSFNDNLRSYPSNTKKKKVPTATLR